MMTTFKQFKCILSFANAMKMKHSNGLRWPLNVVLKPGLIFECIIIKRSYKSHEIKIGNVLLYRNCALFYGWHKPLVKSWNKMFRCFLSKLIVLKVSLKQMTKTTLVLLLGKFIFVRTIFRMDTQLHTQVNRDIWRNFLFLLHALNLSKSNFALHNQWVNAGK